MSHTNRNEAVEAARHAVIALWERIAAEHGGVRILEGQMFPNDRLVGSVYLSGPIHERTALGHWAFTNRVAANYAVSKMDVALEESRRMAVFTAIA